MKGSSRSNRLPTSDPPDDWVDGSWTVDCICGVNFDDGEEMVNCDECGVWVHTRCSRYVKGEKSFACDKCKNKSSRNNSEETEVAQLLVELPTKTIKMNNNNNACPLSNRPPWRPYRLWTERPIDDRVHVQGIPGGDPSLFQGLSSIFTSELWKCSGYVPKKFNFCYREFPCWDKQQDVEAKADGDTENIINKGAGVLYSLSKETFVASRTPDLVTMKGQVKVGGSDKKASKERKWEGGDVKSNTMQNSAKKEKLRSPVIQCGKRNREDSGPSKDQSIKKKNRSVQKEHDKRAKGHAIKTVVIRSTNARQVEVGDSKAHRVLGFDAIDDKHEHEKNAASQELASTAQVSAGGCIEKPKRNAAADEENSTPRSCEVSGFGYSRHKRVKNEKLSHDASDSAKSEELPLPSQGKDTVTRNTVKKEGLLHDSDRNSGVQLETPTSDLPKAMPLVEVVVNSALEVRDTEVRKNLDTTALFSSTYCDDKTKLGAITDDAKEVLRSHASDVVAETDCRKDLVVLVQSVDCESENFKANEAGPIASHCHDPEKDAGKDLDLASDCQFEKDEKITHNSSDNKLQYLEPEGSMEITKVPSDSKEVPKGTGDTMKLVEAIPRSPPSQRKVLSAGKSSSSSSTIVISKFCLSDRNRTGNSQSASPIGKEVISSSSMGIKKESEPVDIVKGQGKHDKPKSMPKASPKSSVNSVLKASQASKTTSSPFSRHYTSVGKDSSRHLSSKSSSVENSPHPSCAGEPASSLQAQHPTHGLSKNIATTGQHRGEKAAQSNSQSTSKLAQSTSGHLAASNTPAGLSDEELALLLHQELNSSPRVPRVPRVRHTGSLPQLSSATATSMLIKRTSSSGGKEQHTFSRRKSKDAHKDGSRSSLDRDTEARKGDRVPSPSDSAKPCDALPPVAANPESLHSARKNVEHLSTPAASGAASSVEANELKTSSMQDSRGNYLDDDTDIKKSLGPTHRTLPGLIAEIMGKGRRMTYEELCNAVLPHWQNLRKHNGERYAYSSHSQAVLDCLRNRTEWAQLVDRGPKTNASRKKRKIDSEAESEDGEGRICKESEGRSLESTKEEFPKSRRNARKGRRLSLRGRSINEGRRKIETGSDHTASFSDSGEESASSEDGSQASGMGAAARSGASASSDEIAAAVS